MVGLQEIYYKLYLCLSLVLLPGGLDTHLHFAANVTLTQPCAQRPKCGPSHLLLPGLRWIHQASLGPSAEPPVGATSCVALLLALLLSQVKGSCSPGGQPCLTQPWAFWLGSIESCLGPFAQGKAQLSKPSLLFLVAHFTVFLSIPWLWELELTGRCLIRPVHQQHLSLEVGTASRAGTKGACP